MGSAYSLVQSEIQNMIQALFMDTMKTGGNVNFKFGQEGGMFNNFGSLEYASIRKYAERICNS